MSSSRKPALKLAWCDHKAAKHAVEHWHYSAKMPRNKLVKIGVWEDGAFVGAVIFGPGASDALGAPYGATSLETCELVRIALRDHRTPVTRIVSVALRLLKRANPGLRLVVSFADPSQGHHGGIYQGGNWIYVGMTEPSDEYVVNGVRMHGRAIRKTMEKYRIPGNNTLERIRNWRDPNAYRVDGVSKHRYIYPLDDETRRRVLPLAQPYPKRAGSKDSVASATHAGEGGANPTPALHATAEAA